MDAAQGRGWAVIKDGELHGMIFFHGGDDSGFVAEVEAAETLGFSTVQIVWYVIAPHIVRALYPALSNHYIIMTLGTSMAAIFGVEELTGRALNANAVSFRSIEIFSLTALIYVGLTVVASAALYGLGRWLFRVRVRAF